MEEEAVAHVLLSASFFGARLSALRTGQEDRDLSLHYQFRCRVALHGVVSV